MSDNQVRVREAARVIEAKTEGRRRAETELENTQRALDLAVKRGAGAEVLRLRSQINDLQVNAFRAASAEQETIKSVYGDVVEPIHAQEVADAGALLQAKEAILADTEQEYQQRIRKAREELTNAARAKTALIADHDAWKQGYYFERLGECSGLVRKLAPTLGSVVSGVS